MVNERKNFLSTTRNTFRLLGRKDQVYAIRSVFYSILQALLEVLSISLVIPLLFQQLGQTNTLSKEILPYINLIDWRLLITVLVLIFILKNAGAFWIMRKQAIYLNNLYLELSESVFRKYYQMTLVEQVRENSSERFRKIKTSAYDFAYYVLNSYLLLSADILITACMTGLLLWFDYRVVFVLIALCLPLVAFYYFFRKNVIHKLDQSFRELTPKANVILSQGIQSFAETKIYRKENYFISRFSEMMKTTNRLLSDLKTFSSLPNRIVETVAIVAFAALFIYSKITGPRSQELIVIIALFSMALYKIVPSITRILIHFSNIQTYSYSISELERNEFTQDVLKNKPLHSFHFNNQISIKDLYFAYPGNQFNPIISNLNLTIRKGEFVLLEGPSGAGKTTLIYLLAGLIIPARGEISIDDTLLNNTNLKSWQKNISLVTQTPLVLQDTVIHNIAFGLPDSEIDFNRVNNIIQKTGLKEFIESLPGGYESMLGENGLTISGGQRQRLVLARAMYRNPSVLLLDEITNQLDHPNKMVVLECLRDLCNKGTTVVLASHDPVVKPFANSTFLIGNSKHYQAESMSL